MQKYVLRRLLFAVPTVLIVTVVAFMLLRLAPGDVVDNLLSQSGGVTPAQRQALRHELGIDQNPVKQYITWIAGAVHGDFGRSMANRRPIGAQLRSRLSVTIELGLLALLISLALALPIGIISAVKAHGAIDQALRLFSVLGLAFPDFWLATLLIIFLAREYHWLPPPYRPLLSSPRSNLVAVIFPAVIAGYRLSAITSRMCRSTMLDALNQDYVRTARSKGLRERTVVLGHTVKNAMIPVLSVVGNQVAYLLGGLVLMEVIFDLPGIGSMAYLAVTQRDYPVVQATVFLFAIMLIVTNLVVDLLFVTLDPRIRYS
jgi:peptide/nickel transport system permease protein